MRIHLLRHGQTHGNVAGALDTAEPGLDLTDLGHAQARAAAPVLAERAPEAIFVSRLIRTHQTAAPTAGVLDIAPTLLPGLEEINAGDLEMSTEPGDAKLYLTTVSSWIEGDLTRRIPGGESGEEFLERYDQAIATIAGSGVRSALIVSHGAAIRAWTAIRASGIGDQWRRPLHNTACLTVGAEAAGFRLHDWHADPIGGEVLEDHAAPDPTGDID